MIAGDRQITDSSGVKIMFSLPKIRRVEGGLIGVAGDADVCLGILHYDLVVGGNYRQMLTTMNKLQKYLEKHFEEPDYELLMVSDTVWSYSQGVLLEHDYFAIGTGYQIAIGALAHNASPVEACAYAIQHMSGCGGNIDALRLTEG